ncbi:hypothetical protein GCM10011371_19620 [Novosphingobium marinum]|uniref:Outer membrane protein OmpA-like peptidoglycan-associated protein n=2 Tax=Novosphingobium marinum TaxID=1514948 RepID=A0A7Y9XZA2_9SPHN|nr:OmpA family protein [Novosphingobium marinum]NYH96075.1 outer membrane protein OmpA-like peptidoglycan-associated protein [Novosphingobium marinum]GGC32248.1 hypothetical protein GCM10011371_19620 [Novosphingobium marinum]
MPTRFLITTAALLLPAAAIAPASAEEAPTRGWTFGTNKAKKEEKKQRVTPTPAPQQRRRTTRAAPEPKPEPFEPKLVPSGLLKTALAQGRSSITVQFEPGSSALQSDGTEQAEELFRAISSPELIGERYLIAGYVESTGNPGASLDLSRQQAEALVAYLVEKGIPRSRFRARGYGDERPRVGMEATSPANRRVEVIKLD